MDSYQVKCTSCGASNRVPAAKEGVAGNCGNCHRKLPPLYLKPQQLDDSTFDSFVAGYGGAVLAEFWAPW